ncbi:unnamed protein product [Jaminaea pallidilutea]
MAASVEEFVELLSSEQHVDIAKLRHLARHGIHASVRGEVWLYLLGVLSADKSHEMTSVRALYNTYDSLLTSCKVDEEVERKISEEANRIWRTRVQKRVAKSMVSDPSTSAASDNVKDETRDPSKAREKPRHRPLIPVKAMNLIGSDRTNAGTRESVEGHFTPAEMEQEASRQAFVRRVGNVVGVWIAQKSADKHEAILLRRRLRQEQQRRKTRGYTASTQANATDSPAQSPSADHSDVTLRHTPTRPSSLFCPSADRRPTLSGSFFSEAGSSSSSASARSSPGAAHDEKSRAKSRSEARPRDPSQSGDNPVLFDSDEDMSSGDASEDEIPFDPAMGMGIDDSPPDFDYPNGTSSPGLNSRKGSSSSRSRSRPGSHKGTPRLGTESILTDEDSDDGYEARTGLHSSRRSRYRTGSGSEGSHSGRSGQSASIGLGLNARDDRSETFDAGAGTTPRRHTTATASRSASARSGSWTPLRPSQHQVRSGYESPLRYSTAHRSASTSKTTRSMQMPAEGALSDRESRGDIDGEDDDDDGAASMASAPSSVPSALDPELSRLQRKLWAPHFVHLASPLVLVSLTKRVEAGVYFAFARLMELLGPSLLADLAQHLAIFHSLLRRTLPDLKAYFEEEGLDLTPFVARWLKSLMAGGGMALTLETKASGSGQITSTSGGSVMRLWDSYFSRLTTPEEEEVKQRQRAREEDDGTGKDYRQSQQAGDSSGEDEGALHSDQQASRTYARQRSPQIGVSNADGGKGRGTVPKGDQGSRSLPLSGEQEPASLHLYVCLAVLLHCRDTLEELDRSECESFLSNLPTDLDVDKILSEALNLRLSHKQAAAMSASRERQQKKKRKNSVRARGGSNGSASAAKSKSRSSKRPVQKNDDEDQDDDGGDDTATVRDEAEMMEVRRQAPAFHASVVDSDGESAIEDKTEANGHHQHHRRQRKDDDLLVEKLNDCDIDDTTSMTGEGDVDPFLQWR